MAGRNDADLRMMARRLQASSGGRGRRSPVYKWLFKHADAFQRLLDETQPSWKSVAAALIDLNVRDGAGNHPSAECVRQAWNAVKQVKVRPIKWPSAPLPTPLPHPVASTAAFYSSCDAEDDETEFKLRALTRPPKQG